MTLSNTGYYRPVTWLEFLSHPMLKAGVMEVALGLPLRDVPKEKWDVVHYEMGRLFGAFLQHEGTPVSPYFVNKRPRAELVHAAKRARAADIWCDNRLMTTAKLEKRE